MKKDKISFCVKELITHGKNEHRRKKEKKKQMPSQG
jgi:hypothetical protein